MRIRFAGICVATLRKAADFLNVTIPAKLMYSPSSRQALASSLSPVKECMTPRNSPRRRASLSMRRMSSPHSLMCTINGRIGLLGKT